MNFVNINSYLCKKYIMLEYLFLFLFFLLFIPILYIKIKYPFWSHQPVFHSYDILKYWTKTPYIIQKSVPLKTKYLCDNVFSSEFLDLPESKTDEAVQFIQEHYVESDKVLTMITKEDLIQDFIGYSNPSYISFYYDKKYEYDTKQEDTLPTIKINNILVGFMTSRAIKIYMTQYNFEEYGYFWDHICTHRNFQNKFLGRSLIQCHERYQRMNNKEVTISLFKREINLCIGVVSLCLYNVHTYPLENIKKPPIKHYTVERVIHNNVAILFDFLYNITHNVLQMPFYVCIFPETNVLDGLIQNGKIIIYALKYKSKILGMYFFKDPKICYDTNEDRNILECIGSILIHKDESLFFGGLLHAIYDIQQNAAIKYKLIAFYDVMHNDQIIDRWKWKYNPVCITQSAYYVYNAVFPNMPYDAKQCFILL